MQQALLKIIEGAIANVPPKGGRKHPQQDFLQIDTSQILFICGGAFVGLDKIVEARLGQQQMGFGTTLKERERLSENELLAKVESEDLVRFGLIPEFIGRVPVVATLDTLTKNAPRHPDEAKECSDQAYQKPRWTTSSSASPTDAEGDRRSCDGEKGRCPRPARHLKRSWSTDVRFASSPTSKSASSAKTSCSRLSRFGLRKQPMA